MLSMCLADQGPTKVMELAPADAVTSEGDVHLESQDFIVVEDWGVLSYEIAWSKQKEFISLRSESRLSDTLAFVEHPAVITIGRKGIRQLVSEGRELPSHLGGIPLFSVERGGEATYHGLGQLVAYPLFKLDLLRTGPRRFLRMMEESLQKVLADCGQASFFSEGKTGLWCLDRKTGAERKLASLGIAVSKSVSYHGLALNVSNDLSPFRLIQPCGYNPEVMTSLAEQMEAIPSMGALKKGFAQELIQRFREKQGSVQ